MDVVLARRFSPFNFQQFSWLSKSMPHVDEWQECLPKFKEDKDDSPTEHLLEFHEHMHQMNIHHEDVLMKLFMYTLEGDAHEWYWSLSPSSISFLERVSHNI
jgi:hypothetical protein